MPRWLSRLLAEPRTQPAPAAEAATVSFPFSAVEGTLALYVTALSDDTLRIAASGGARGGSYSDGKRLFFPTELDLFDDPALARRFYRLNAAWQVLQVRSGALEIAPLLAGADPGRALALYEALAGEWLDRRLAASYPGLTADLSWLRADALARRPAPEHPVEALLQALLAQPLDRLGEIPLPQLALDPQALAQALAADDPNPARELAAALAPGVPSLPGATPPVHYRGRIRVELVRDWSPEAAEPEEEVAPASGSPPENRRRREPLVVDIRPIEQRIQRERRATAGGRHAVQLSLGDREPTITAAQVPLSEAERQGALLYDEWDYRRDDYLREWCAVHLRHPRGGSSDAVERILRQHAALINRLKQQFEALRPERQRLTRQLDGDELDLNALVEDHADRRAGFSAGEKLYSRTLERQRNIALGCLVDLSGSTGAWIDDDPRNDQVIEVTRRAIVFLCEALTTLEDRYALFGFTSGTRKRCEIAVVKDFDETYGPT
ncbi:MAG TPA: hypothetical protein VFI42_12850, partial [Thermomicrobiaceae bacterium]|nr:hypothetical protein [Thermomicrobiaceae bacterium]